MKTIIGAMKENLKEISNEKYSYETRSFLASTQEYLAKALIQNLQAEDSKKEKTI